MKLTNNIANPLSRNTWFQLPFKPILLKKPTPDTRHFAAFSKSLLALALVCTAYTNTASALAFDSHIAISGSVQFDSTGSPTEPENATQSGALTSIVTGSTTTTNLSGATVTGADPLSGTLTDIGDGFGIAFSASGASIPNGEAPPLASSMGNLFGDLDLSIQNNSAVDTFLVSLRVDFSQAVDSFGADAFAQAIIGLQLADFTEEMFSKVVSDTVFGNQEFASTDSNNNTASGTFGGPLSDSNLLTLVYWLAPGDVVNLGSNSPEVTLTGGAADGNFSASNRLLITVASVEKVQEQSVPEPGTLLLLAVGIVSIGFANRRSVGFLYR